MASPPCCGVVEFGREASRFVLPSRILRVCACLCVWVLAVRCCGTGGLSTEHHPEGRVIVLEFLSFTLVILYVPNNGVKAESFRRRRVRVAMKPVLP